MSAAKPVQPAPPPSEQEIRARLGGTFPLYRVLLDNADLTPEWKYYGAKSGWSLKLFYKKRNLCFIGPKEGTFDVAFVFGDRVRQAVLGGPADEDIQTLFQGARRYPEGWGVRVSVASAAELDLVRRLLAIKREQ